MAEISRKFATISIAYVKYREEMRDGKIQHDIAQVIAAVADDGTAWIHRGKLDSQAGWLPILPLPPRVADG